MRKSMLLCRVLLGGVFAFVSVAHAMPSESDIKKAKPVVDSLIANDLYALNKKMKPPATVAAAMRTLAEKSESEAGKFLLLQSIFSVYASNGMYDEAGDALENLNSEISDMSPDEIVKMVDGAMNRVDPEKAPKVLSIYRTAQRKVRCRRRLESAKVEFKKNPNDKALIRTIGDCHAGLGDWPKALKAYSRLGIAAAKYELSPATTLNCDAMAAADFWWDYKAADDEPFKDHAAELYRAAVEKGLATGLRREMALKRIEDSKQLDALRAQARQVAPSGLQSAEVKPASPPVEKPPAQEYTFNYRLTAKGEAILCQPFRGEPCVSPKPDGTLTVPASIDGHKITGIDCEAFVGCDKMAIIVLPPGLGIIDPAVFMHCSSLDKLEIAKGNMLYSSVDGVLYSKDLSKLMVYPKQRDNIKLSPRTKMVEKNAFRGCMFKVAKVPTGIKWIGCWNFGNCPNLETIEFPASLSFLGYGMFGFSDNLRKIVFYGDAPQTETRGQSLMSCASAGVVVEVRNGSKGWAGRGSSNLPSRWPLQAESRSIRYIK